MVTTTIRDDIDEILPGVIADRRHLHQHPELAFEEHETAKFVVERLEQLGVEDIKTGVGRTGVTGLIRGRKGDGKVVMLRADMDALPILEENDVDYKSEVDGKMHACGHDAHTAMLLGVARILMDRRDEFKGTVKLLFQPAEEVPPGGAIEMIRDGALEDPHVDACIGQHVASSIPSGVIAVRSGPDSAGSDRFRAVIQGKGGHAARPQVAVDPVVVAAHVIVALQSLVSRETDPMEAAVLSTTAVLAGEAFNVIPDTAELRGTVRTLSPEVREHMHKRVPEVIEGVAKALGAEAKVEYRLGYPSLQNDEAMARLTREAAIEAVGEENVIEGELGMGGEDFSYFSLERPSCFFHTGTRNEDRGIVWGHHHPKFDTEEEGFVNGMATMATAAMKYLNEN
ncbi:MAG TPA: amidohydrolase [Thermomicrobiales bacterium]|nr:amidohydrolase [Thermomicrobiales bacterium]